MSAIQHCPQCGAPIPLDAPGGVCPWCVFALGLCSFEPSDADPRPIPPDLPPTSAPLRSRFVPPSAAELALHFPHLEILELIGHGGMGAVYKARQRRLDRLVAVKVLPPEIGHDAAFAERFAREARALARLSHNHIVSVYDCGQAGGLFYIVMEYVDGVNLRQTIQSGGLSPAEALAIVPQICEALQYAHDEGIVHRDIKPENILIDRRGRVKIADFGLAKLLLQGGGDHSLTATHQVMGTLRYMAPEQMQGSREVDHRADIYSLGVVFYELLTGELPLGKFALPSKKVQVDVRLDEIVLRSLEQDPEQRYQHASQVKTDVEALPKDARPAMPEPLQTASDGVAFVRLSVFCLLLWLVWSALLAGLHWGYLSEAKWYFQKELPYQYLSGAWTWVSLMFAFFFGYWWYLLAKSPEIPRSLADAWRTLQTPDRRAIGLWVPGVAYLAIWIGATVLTMTLADDDVQTTTLTALLITAPLVAAGSCAWAFRQRTGQLLGEWGHSAKAGAQPSASGGGQTAGWPITQIRFAVSGSRDVAQQAIFHFSALGYQLIEQRPGLCVFQRGGKWSALWATDIRRLRTILSVRTAPADAGRLWVSCDWSIRTLGSWITRRDIAKLEVEGRGLEELLNPKIEPKPVSFSPTAAAPPAKPGAASEPGWEAWWFEQTPATRKMLKVAMFVFASACMISFLTTVGHSSGKGSSVRIGIGDPWLQYESGQAIHFDPLTWSFASGVVSVFVVIALWSVIRADRRRVAEAGLVAVGFWSSSGPIITIVIPLAVLAATLAAAVLISWIMNRSG